jgi:putative ABC transport system permease protein
MLDPRWRKILRDAWLHRSRTLLVVLAIAVGLLGAGSVLNAWSLLRLATAQGYRASHPVAATLQIEPLDTALAEPVRGLPGIAAVRLRRTLYAREQADGERKTVALYALDDFERADIGRLQPLSGAWPPANGGLAIEKSSLTYSAATVGERLMLDFANSRTQALPVTGVVRDVSLPPGWMDHVVYAYVTPGTLASLGLPAGFNELQFTAADPNADRDAVRRLAYQIKLLAEHDGRRVSRIDVPVPGQHPHAAQMNSLMLTQGAFGVLTLIVCGFLIVNLISAMLAGQIREIGVMKAVGARTGQLASLYLALALVLGLLASAIALPLAAAIGRSYGALQGEMLNFPIETYAIPAWALAAQLLVGALLPVVAAAVPVMRGCRMPVVAALREQGLNDDGGVLQRRLLPLPGLGRPLLLSINNAFRRRQRLVLTLLALASGGAVYLGADALRGAVHDSVDRLFAAQHFDLVLRLNNSGPADRTEALASAVSGVTRAEAWTTSTAGVIHQDGLVGNNFNLIGLPPRSPMIAPAVNRGRWMRDDDQHALVVGSALLKDEPDLQPGTEVTLMIEGRPTQWTIVGIVDSGPMAVAYTARATLDTLLASDRSSALVVASASRATDDQLGLILRLRDAFGAAGMPVAGSQLLSENRRSIEDHLLMVSAFLGAMSWVMIVVGGMGLASTMSLAVLERTREISVMRAIGASRRAILSLILTEAVVITVLGWLASLPLAAPMSAVLAAGFSRVMFAVPVHYIPSAGGMLMWLAMAIIVSIVASVLPAWGATRIAVARALSYE